MIAALAALLLVFWVRWLRARRRIPVAERATLRPANLLRLRRRTALVLAASVLAFVSVGPAMLGSTVAVAADCKEAPTPEEPGSQWADFFDSDADTARGDGSSYGTYGWAGLHWATYDLGCGPDVARAPGAVGDTALGNKGLDVAQIVAGTAIWMDRQVRVSPPPECDSGMQHLPDHGPDCGRGARGVLSTMDVVVLRANHALTHAFYGDWVGVALLIVGITVLAHALRARSSHALRAAVIAGFALFCAGLTINAPLNTVHAFDRQFDAAVTDVTGKAMHDLGVDPDRGPRDVLVDQVIVPQVMAGWFGDSDSAAAQRYGAEIRDATALTYAERDKLRQLEKACLQKRPRCDNVTLIKTMNAVQAQVYGPKHKEFTSIASSLHNSQDSYKQFNGKDAGRTGKGWTAAIEVVAVCMLWIAASVLKFVGLLIIRLAVLFGPLWVPAAMVSETVMSRVVKLIGAALFWAVIASAAVAAELLLLVLLFGRDIALSGGWRIFLLVLVSAVLWAVLRPFKRISQMIGNSTGGAVAQLRNAGRRVARHGWRSAAAAGVGAYAGAQAASRWQGRGRDSRSDAGPVGEGAQPAPVEGQYRWRREASPSRPAAAAPGLPASRRPVPVAIAAGPVPVEVAAARRESGAAPGPAAGPGVVVDERGMPVSSAAAAAAPAATYLGDDGEVVYEVFRPGVGVQQLQDRGGGRWE